MSLKTGKHKPRKIKTKDGKTKTHWVDRWHFRTKIKTNPLARPTMGIYKTPKENAKLSEKTNDGKAEDNKKANVPKPIGNTNDDNAPKKTLYGYGNAIIGNPY
jgi:hypothetical protein